MSDQVPMTPNGYVALKNELKRLKEVDRPQNVRDIEEARAHGDLSENAEFQYAKEKQGFIEGRIMELEDKLARAHVIDPASLSGDKIVFGATVELYDLDTDADVTYQIVGVSESNPKAGKISIESPIARALIGKSEGDEVQIKVPGGSKHYEINAVRYE